MGLAVSVNDQVDCSWNLLWKGVSYLAGAYAAAHVMFYAFHGVLGLPISFAWCVVIALVPLVNLGGCILAGTVLTWAAMIYFGLRVANWLLGRVLEWLA